MTLSPIPTTEVGTSTSAFLETATMSAAMSALNPARMRSASFKSKTVRTDNVYFSLTPRMTALFLSSHSNSFSIGIETCPTDEMLLALRMPPCFFAKSPRIPCVKFSLYENSAAPSIMPLGESPSLSIQFPKAVLLTRALLTGIADSAGMLGEIPLLTPPAWMSP